MTKKMINEDSKDSSKNLKIDVEEIRNKLDKYMKAKIPVHIVFKIKEGQQKVRCSKCGSIMPEKAWKKHLDIHDEEQEAPIGELMPRFLNGYLIGKKSEDIYIIDERKLGQTYILIDEVFSVTVYAKNNEALAEEVVEKAGFKKGEGFSENEISLLKDLPDYTPQKKKESKTSWK